jgi:uncharacterized membrane protein
MHFTSIPYRPDRFRVRTVGWRQPLTWLGRGLAELRDCPGPGLLHGIACALFGGLLWWWAHDLFWMLAGAFSGFLLVAPIVATGLYANARAREQGLAPGFAATWQVWRGRDPRLVHFGLLLAFAGTGWVLTSASLVTVFAGAPIEKPLDFVRLVVLSQHGWLFEIWLVLGALLAAPVFASSVIAIPLLLDTDASVLEAVLTSWRAVLASPGPLALWAGIIMTLTLAGMATLLLGLILVVPLLAYASWHAYRDIVAPPAEAPEGR